MSNDPTRNYHELRLLDYQRELETLKILEKTMLKNLSLALELKEFGHAKALIIKLEDNAMLLELAEHSIRTVYSDIELDKRMGIY